MHASHAVNDDTLFDPVSWFEWMVALLDEPEPVDGLGDAAVYEDGLLYVRGQGPRPSMCWSARQRDRRPSRGRR